MRWVAIIGLGAMLVSCGPSTPPSIAQADENISDFNASGEQINIRLQFEAASTPEELAEEMEASIGNVAGAIAARASSDVEASKFVSFDIRSGDPEAPERFGNYRFDTSAFTGVDGNARSGKDVLNSVRDVEIGSGDTVPLFVRWCALRSEQARRLVGFCDRVAGSWATRG